MAEEGYSGEERRTELPTAEQIQAGQAAQAGKLASIAAEMVAEAREQTKLMRAQIKASGLNPLFVKSVAAALACLVVLGVSAVVIAVLALGTAQDASGTANAQLEVSVQNKEILDLIKSCTTRDGDCAKRGQDDQAKAIAAIIGEFVRVDGVYSRIVSECVHVGTAEQVLECFHARAKEAGLEK